MYSRLSFVTKSNKKTRKKKYIYGTQLVISSIINLYIIAYQIGQGTEFTGYRIETKQRYREQGGKSSLLFKIKVVSLYYFTFNTRVCLTIYSVIAVFVR